VEILGTNAIAPVTGAAADGKNVGLPHNTLHMKLARGDVATVLREVGDHLELVFERAEVSGPILIAVIGSDGINGGWDKRFVPPKSAIV